MLRLPDTLPLLTNSRELGFGREEQKKPVDLSDEALAELEQRIQEAQRKGDNCKALNKHMESLGGGPLKGEK